MGVKCNDEIKSIETIWLYVRIFTHKNIKKCYCSKGY